MMSEIRDLWTPSGLIIMNERSLGEAAWEMRGMVIAPPAIRATEPATQLIQLMLRDLEADWVE